MITNKTFKLTIIAMLLLLNFSCNNIQDKQSLNYAERSINSKPDSALLTLEKIKFPEKLPSDQKALFGLLSAQAADKVNKTFMCDTILSFSLDYYKSTNDSTRFVECSILRAKQEEWKKEIPASKKLLIDAIRFVTVKERNNLQPLIYDRYIQSAFTHRDFKTVRKYCQQLLKFSYKWQSYAYYFIGLSYDYENKNDQSLFYLKKCISIAVKNHDPNYFQYLRNYAGLIEMKPDEAIPIYKKALNLLPNKRNSNIFSSLGYCFLQKHQLDSATYYTHLAEQQYKSEWTDKGNEYFTLLNEITTLHICLNYAKGQKYFRTRIGSVNDSIYNNISTNKALQDELTEVKFKTEQKTLHAQIKQQHLQLTLLFIIFISILSILSIFIYSHRKKELLVQRNETIETLQLLLNEARQLSPTDKRNSHVIKNLMLKQLGIIKLMASSPTEHNMALLQQMASITNDEKKISTLIVWKDLYPIIDSIYNNFYSKLSSHYKSILTEKEIQICCLLCAEFSTKEISVVTNQSLRTIYQRKSNIRKKINTGEKEDIVSFVQSI